MRKILLCLLVVQAITLIWLRQRVIKAELCNKAFVLYFRHNLGINVNLDRLAEDAKRWVNDPRYQ